MLFHLLKRFEVHAAKPATVPQEEGRFGLFGINSRMFFHQVHFLMFDKVTAVGALPPGWVLVKFPVSPKIFRTGALRTAFRARVMIAILLRILHRW